MKNIYKLINIKLQKVVLAFLLATVFLLTTACNSGNEVGARPEVPPVQMGGQNNPHKTGGDGMTQYRSPVNDSNLSKDKDRASLPANVYFAAANNSKTSYPTDDNNVEGLLYSDSDKAASLNSTDDFVSPQRQAEVLDPTQIPAKKQPTIDRSNPDNRLLEKTGQMFDDAGDFSAN